MAVMGLHNISAFGPSFGESQSKTRPTTPASTLLKMWRELEGEHVPSHQSYRSRQHRNGSDSECLSTTISQGSDNGDDVSQEVFTASEDNNSIVLEQSSDLGEIERERLRRVFQEWTNSGANKGHSSNNGFLLENGAGKWLGENECDRVRVIREWVQMNTQDRNNCGSVGDGVIEQVREGVVIPHPEIGLQRIIRRVCGRQALLDLLHRAQSERKGELLALSEKRPVSAFTHRNRIQALLRGRFLRNETLVTNERPSSVPATELGLLKQRHTVSDLRDGFLSKVDNIASTSANGSESDSSSSDENNGDSENTCREVEKIHSASDSENVTHGNMNMQELQVRATEVEDPVLDNEESEHEEASHYPESPNSREEPNLDTVARQHDALTSVQSYGLTDDGQTNIPFSSEPSSELDVKYCESLLFQEPSYGNVEEESQNQTRGSHVQEWSSHNFQESIDSWLDMPSTGRIDTFYFPDYDNDVHSIELRELFSRRRVSSLLGSSFRESLNQVLQSHVERLGHGSDDWELNDTPFLPEQDQELLNGGEILDPSDGAERNPFLPSSSMFSQSLWDEDLQGENWPQPNSDQELEKESDIIDEIRIDMARLHQRMDHMQNMLEECMDMQKELQRSVRQELSAALNQSNFSRDASLDNQLHDESQWNHVRRGICCLCQDNKIDSLLYRCGHMCTCLSCAENLVQSIRKCPMCQAPAVEAVRAFLIHE